MYTNREERNVEKICYDKAHISEVLTKIKQEFEGYFKRFVETQAGILVNLDSFKRLGHRIGIQGIEKKYSYNPSDNYKSIIRSSIEAFEKDRKDYEDIFDLDTLEEYEEDPNTFKSKVLKNECPVIRKTLANQRAKELDKYRHDFRLAVAEGLLGTVTKLCKFAEDYESSIYDAQTYETATSYEDFMLSPLDTADYTYFGVIGGGIKSMMLYKNNPKVFPSRSRNAIWALWYLTDKELFGCHTDSEFLMINVNKCITQQNYYYPYELFTYYAFEIYKMLQEKATELNAHIDPDYRYVIVDAFFDFVAGEHKEEIDFLSRQLKEDRGYCCA